MKKIVLCSIIKNEIDYLDEWIDYHFGIGVDAIYLYEDYDSISHKNICDKYDNVYLLYVNDILDDCQYTLRQFYVYEHFLNNNKMHDVLFAAFIDLDEFITFGDGYNFDKFIDDFKSYNGVYIQWQNYNANGLIFKSNESLQERFTCKCEPVVHDINWCFKSIVNLQIADVSLNNIHEVNNGVNTNFEYDCTSKHYDKIYLRHYFTKSWEEWCYRYLVKGKAIPTNRTLMTFFECNDDMLTLKDDLIKLYYFWKEKYGSTVEDCF